MLGASCSPCCTPPCPSFDPDAITAVEVTLDGDDYISNYYSRCNGLDLLGQKTGVVTYCFFGSLFSGTYSLSPYISPALGARTSWRYWFEDNDSPELRSYIDVKFHCVSTPGSSALLAEIQTKHWYQLHSAQNLVETSVPCLPPITLTPIPEVASPFLFSQRLNDGATHSILFSDFVPEDIPLVAAGRFPLSLIPSPAIYTHTSTGTDCPITGLADSGNSSSGSLRFEMAALKAFF